MRCLNIALLSISFGLHTWLATDIVKLARERNYSKDIEATVCGRETEIRP